VSKYVVRRSIQAVPVLLIISFVLFLILLAQPIHAWDYLLYRPNLTPEERKHILDYYGFSLPWWQQYLIQLKNWLPWWTPSTGFHIPDLGTSYFSHQTTWSLIAQRLPNSVILMGAAYLLTLVIAIPIGVIAAVKQYSKFDTIVTAGAFVGFSLPNFWLGLMLIILLAVWPYEHLGFKLFPTNGMSSDLSQGGFPLIWTAPFDLAWHLALPASVLAVQFIAQYSRFIRGAMLDIMNQDFIRTARAKGLREARVVVRHAFRNALLPLITLMGLDIPQLFVGAIITEQVFAWPGMGRMFLESAYRNDSQVLMGVLVLLAGLVVLGNLIADVVYGWADPRIQYR
jgi:peptide/nickel transport system permease protein